MPTWNEAYRECRLCPRQCRVDRLGGERGACGETAVCRVGTVCAHFGEEPPISGTRGSGTVFFSGCSSRCFFCQNYQISRQGLGHPVSGDELYAQVQALIAAGVHNLNFVTPDHFWPHIRVLIERLASEGHALPLVFNCSGYQTTELVDEVAGRVRIFLPDFKFADPLLARTCMGDERYPQLALAALTRMVEKVGFLEPWDPTGATPAREGVLVRHLVLPGQVDNSLESLRLLRREFGRMLPISVMSQFRPVPECRSRQTFTRPLTTAEYQRVCDLAEELGFLSLFVQSNSGDPAFLPDFEDPTPFPGPRPGDDREG